MSDTGLLNSRTKKKKEKSGGWLKTVPTSLRGFRRRDKNFFLLEKFKEDFQAFSGFA